MTRSQDAARSLGDAGDDGIWHSDAKVRAVNRWQLEHSEAVNRWLSGTMCKKTVLSVSAIHSFTAKIAIVPCKSFGAKV